MKETTECDGIVGTLRREAKAALRLSPWLLASLLLAALLWRSDLAAMGGMFQSSPPIAQPTAVPTLTPTATSEGVPPTVTTEAPVPTATIGGPTETATIEAIPEQPTVALPATLVPTNVPSPTASPTETPVLPTETPLPPTPTSTPTAADLDEGQRYSEEDSNLLFDWSMLFDSVALGASYIWLCCGGLAFVGVPVFFIILWWAARRRQQDEEEQ
jgi:hypothetical protein